MIPVKVYVKLLFQRGLDVNLSEDAEALSLQLLSNHGFGLLKREAQDLGKIVAHGTSPLKVD
jgi:hypothetical protein